MATVLDLGLIRAFDAIFPVILAWAIVFALLQETKVITESVSINAVLAVVAALMVLLSDSAIEIINFTMPWFTVIIIFFVILMLTFQVFGLKDSDFSSIIKDQAVYMSVLGLIGLVVVIGLATVFGQDLTSESFVDESGTVIVNEDGTTSSSNYNDNIIAFFQNKKVLALIVIFGIAICATYFLTGKS